MTGTRGKTRGQEAWLTVDIQHTSPTPRTEDQPEGKIV